MNCCTSGVPFCCKNKVFLSAVKTISCTDVVSMLSDTHGFTRTLVIHLDLPSLQQYTWVHESLHSPPTPPSLFAIHHLGLLNLQAILIRQFCNILGFTMAAVLHTLLLLQHLGLSRLAAHWGSLSPCLQHTVIQSVHNTLGVLFTSNTPWFSYITTPWFIQTCSTLGFLLVCNTLWFNRFTIHLGFSSFATHLGSFTLQQIMVLSSAVTAQFTLFAIYFGLLSSHCWFTPYAKHSGLQCTSVPSGLQGILVHFSETRCHPL